MEFVIYNLTDGVISISIPHCKKMSLFSICLQKPVGNLRQVTKPFPFATLSHPLSPWHVGFTVLCVE